MALPNRVITPEYERPTVPPNLNVPAKLKNIHTSLDQTTLSAN